MCPHNKTVIETRGSLTFANGVVDTLHDVVICLDCGEEITCSQDTETEPEPPEF